MRLGSLNVATAGQLDDAYIVTSRALREKQSILSAYNASDARELEKVWN